ncbi:MAG: hypothetical protein KZQ85_10940 [Candidatus Thiodiazotropha sp. (ex Myrtea sp. 'scaly one' KF741663)]|nr:hypothetical protein [Candidatus Thiodiazotropha sp. (ex Myrtea sp. 'scaly one' KF741663)]
MKYFLKAIFASLFVISSHVYAINQTNVTVGMVGSEEDSSRVYVGISPNTNGCSYNGIYFNDEKELDLSASIAMAAKLSGKTVRLGYTQPGGTGTQCYGYSIYIE